MRDGLSDKHLHDVINFLKLEVYHIHSINFLFLKVCSMLLRKKWCTLHADNKIAKAGSLSEPDDCIPGYGDNQSHDRYPALRKIQLNEADGETSEGERGGG